MAEQHSARSTARAQGPSKGPRRRRGVRASARRGRHCSAKTGSCASMTCQVHFHWCDEPAIDDEPHSATAVWVPKYFTQPHENCVSVCKEKPTNNGAQEYRKGTSAVDECGLMKMMIMTCVHLFLHSTSWTDWRIFINEVPITFVLSLARYRVSRYPILTGGVKIEKN